LRFTPVGQQFGEIRSDIARKNLRTQPGIKVAVGFRFKMRVNRDILFEALHTLAALLWPLNNF
jgi:hypothetical protein